MTSMGIVILAAGQGTRLKLDMPKPLAPVLGKRLIDYPIMQSHIFLNNNNLSGETTIVKGYGKDLLDKHIDNEYKEKPIKLSSIVQLHQLGTADAVRSYFDQKSNAIDFDYTIIMCADTPLIRSSDLLELFDVLKNNELDAVVASFIADNPKGYGRIIREVEQTGFRIAEEKDATAEERSVKEVNSGLYIVKTKYLFDSLRNIDNKNKSGEFYLTDLFKVGAKVNTLCFADDYKFIGVNTLAQLEHVTALLKNEKNNSLREDGVRFVDSSSSYIDYDVIIGAGSVVYPGVIVEGNSQIGEECIIEASSIIKNSYIESNVRVKGFSYLEDCIVRSKADVGPYVRLRPSADIGTGSKIGNFVEVKNSKLSAGVKVSHLSYVGDAEIGKNTNIGCGFITCNYDGANKHKTIIGENCFIGSDSQTVAPVEIGNDCFVASGSTITNSIKDGAFAISRSKQMTKDGLAHKFIRTKKNN